MKAQQFLAFSLIAFAAAPAAAWAQQPSNEPLNAVQIYKLDYVLTTRDGNQPATQRRYSLLIESGAQGRLRTGSRVYYATAENQFQAAEVGFNLTCRVREKGDKLSAEIELGVTDVGPVLPPSKSPSVNSETVQTTLSLTPGQPAKAFVWDSAAGASPRRYEIDVTATRLGR